MCRSLLESIGLPYDHSNQLENVCVAQAVLRHVLADDYHQQQVTDGLRRFYWPCRMERFRYDRQEIILDGCHNDDSVRRFMHSLAEKFPGHSRIVLFGAGMEKSTESMLSEVFHGADRVILVQSKHFKSYAEGQLMSMVPEGFEHKLVYLPAIENSLTDCTKSIGGTVAHRLLHCLRTISRLPPQPTVIAVCGSLFVAADAREALFK